MFSRWQRWFVLCLLGGLLQNSLPAQNIGEELSEAAQDFLSALKPEQKKEAQFEFTNDERFNWHFVPRERKGIPFKSLDKLQRDRAHALIDATLSQAGYIKATTIMSLENVLKDLEKGKGAVRDPELYYISIFGTPGKTNAWAWRLEGHHLSFNITANGNDISGTPTFMGSNPGEAIIKKTVSADGKSSPEKTIRILANEEDWGRQLIKSCDQRQRAEALIATNAPKEILTGNQREVTPLEPVGLSRAKMDAMQRELLLKIIQEYIGRYRPEIAQKDLAKIEKAGLDKITFGWAGGLEREQAHYYRIQGPTFVLEYDNIQNNANHVHTVWRDFGNDFGRDILREHYKETPHP
ncbi:MAG: hypothetical protein JWM68_5372 [Verrucomicrobiales bacterium]|nr:hypothetical protein [Verrucomicrobiales bacterium]